MYYSLIKYKKKGYYDILTDISQNFTLFQLMDYLGDLNHAVSIVGCWIFYSNYKKSLVLNRASLDMICAPSVGEEQAAKFELIFYCSKIHLLCSAIKEGSVVMYKSKHNHIQ